MATNKTQPTQANVDDYLQSIADPVRKRDAIAMVKIMHEVTGAEATMWGPSIVGFGKNHYVYETGREGDTVAVGFSARKDALTLYGVLFYDQNADLAAQLGPIKTGKGCVYIKDLSIINEDILRQMIKKAYDLRNNA